MRVIVLVAALLAGTMPSRSTELPQYDFYRYCIQLAKSLYTPSKRLYDLCVKQNRESREKLKTEIETLDAATFAYCNKLATAVGPGSYTLLRACIVRDQDAKRFPHKVTGR